MFLCHETLWNDRKLSSIAVTDARGARGNLVRFVGSDIEDGVGVGYLQIDVEHIGVGREDGEAGAPSLRLVFDTQPLELCVLNVCHCILVAVPIFTACMGLKTCQNWQMLGLEISAGSGPTDPGGET